MSELSGFFTTSGSPSGDQQASYTQAQLAIAHKIMAACSNFEGIAPSFLNELSVTATGANTVTMAEGGAMVDGLWYYNDSPQNINIPSAAAGLTRIDRIVIRADWGGFNVSAHRIAGTDHANPTPPAITQTSGTTYDILCVQVEVDDAGNCTVTGEKTFAAAPVDGVTLEESGGSLRIKNDGVDDTKVGNRVPQFYRRQGGSATDWSAPGSGNHTPGAVRMQAGAAAALASSVSVTFPTAFSQIPIVYLTNSSGNVVILRVSSVSASGFTANAHNHDGTPASAIGINWLAIGPE